MQLQSEILLHPAARRWGEDASLLLLLEDCLRGIGTLGLCGIMILGRQWPLPLLPPPFHMPPPPLLLLQRIKFIYPTAISTATATATATPAAITKRQQAAATNSSI